MISMVIAMLSKISRLTADFVPTRTAVIKSERKKPHLSTRVKVRRML